MKIDRNHTQIIEFPPFLECDVEIWFIYVEIEFSLYGITDEFVKYGNVFLSLPRELLREIVELLHDVPENEYYATMKNHLIRQGTISADLRIEQLMISEVLGDRLPSELLRSMREIVGRRDFDKNRLRELFLERLPAEIRETVAFPMLTDDLDRLAIFADRLQHGIDASVNTERALNKMDKLLDMLEEIDKSMRKTHISKKPRRRCATPSRRDSVCRENGGLQLIPKRDKVCWFHDVFGEDARKCRKPCSFLKASSSKCE